MCGIFNYSYFIGKLGCVYVNLTVGYYEWHGVYVCNSRIMSIFYFSQMHRKSFKVDNQNYPCLFVVCLCSDYFDFVLYFINIYKFVFITVIIESESGE